MSGAVKKIVYGYEEYKHNSEYQVLGKIYFDLLSGADPSSMVVR